jgi:hypothetical protein
MGFSSPHPLSLIGKDSVIIFTYFTDIDVFYDILVECVGQLDRIWIFYVCSSSST